MENATIIDFLIPDFSEKILLVDESADILTLIVDSSAAKNIIRTLKEQLNFFFLTDLCGIHYPEQEKELGVIYHLHNLLDNKRIRIKAFVTKENPQVESLTDIFSGANWMERETYDFYGIEFTGHPNLKRILNVDYMDYFPMRKEYPLEDATRTDKDDKFFGR
ncbi:NADH-quinone oxidoreductase subunit C [Parabacteroides sp. FAFU027]|uniref:NADH-quinone oxidoreductase subunit C n=1 Tax=Parabacteroides sp. FAFU027 TaxID=2922715 RepID=UPI001FB0332E|nr:NADH-quinone oxidoreductase subunit C [Parabacteroides sp. FAFU027]